MTDQTKKLVSSLPMFAEMLGAADGSKEYEWKIVRWYDLDPNTVLPDQPFAVRPEDLDGMVTANSFASQTAALRLNITGCYHRCRSWSRFVITII